MSNNLINGNRKFSFNETKSSSLQNVTRTYTETRSASTSTTKVIHVSSTEPTLGKNFWTTSDDGSRGSFQRGSPTRLSERTAASNVQQQNALTKKKWFLDNSASTSGSSNCFQREFGQSASPQRTTPITSSVPTYTPSIPVGRLVVSKEKYKGSEGLMLIFNHVKYHKNRYYERKGTERDVERLKATFGKFKIQIEVKNDLTVSAILGQAKILKTKDFKTIPFVIIVILTHGHKNGLLAAYDNEYSLEDDLISEIIKNPSLADKPKIFIIQACRGTDLSHTDYDHIRLSRKYPAELLKLFSTYEGFVAERKEDGSIFIRILCEHIDQHGMTKDLKEITTMVTEAVKKNARQVPTTETTLTKRMVLGDYAR